MFKFTKYEQKAKVVLIPVGEIKPNPKQPRRTIEKTELFELSKSIEENGLISPITIRKTGASFELITGQRRLEAFRILHMDRIPAIIEEVSDELAVYHALIENLQRSALSFLDEALAIQSTIKDLHITQSQLAERLGISQSAVANKLRILKLPHDILSIMAEHNLTERHARALIPLNGNQELSKIVDTIIEKKLTVKETESLVENTFIKKTASSSKPKPIIKLKDVRIFNTTLKKAMGVMQNAGINISNRVSEDEDNIIYTISIPKKYAASQPSIPSLAISKNIL